jgi:RNA polymerase sigma-70 factor (ECF subfamily)
MPESELARDQGLVVQSLKGDRKAFETLVRLYQPLVSTVIYRAVEDQEASRDLTQDTFVKAFRALASYDGKRSFKTWLLTIANNCALDHLRSANVARNRSLDAILEEEPHLEPVGPLSTEKEAELSLFLGKLSWALSLIPLRYRQAFILRYQFDLSYEDIATVMKESDNNVRTLLFRAKERLRKLISADRESSKQ